MNQDRYEVRRAAIARAAAERKAAEASAAQGEPETEALRVMWGYTENWFIFRKTRERCGNVRHKVHWCEGTDSWETTSYAVDTQVPKAHPDNLADHLAELNSFMARCPKMVDAEKSRRMAETARKAAYLKRKRIEAKNEKVY